MSRTKRQNDQLLAALQCGPITARDALNRFGIARLAARILELRQDGWSITSQMIETTNRDGEVCRVARYVLTDTNRCLPIHQPGRGRVTL